MWPETRMPAAPGSPTLRARSARVDPSVPWQVFCPTGGSVGNGGRRWSFWGSWRGAGGSTLHARGARTVLPWGRSTLLDPWGADRSALHQPPSLQPDIPGSQPLSHDCPPTCHMVWRGIRSPPQRAGRTTAGRSTPSTTDSGAIPPARPRAARRRSSMLALGWPATEGTAPPAPPKPPVGPAHPGACCRTPARARRRDLP